MSAIDRLQNIQVSPKMAAICIAALIVVSGCVIIAVKRNVSSLPASVAETVIQQIPTQAKVEVSESTETDAKGDKGTVVTSLKMKDPYTIITERNIFKPIPGTGANAQPGGGGTVLPLAVGMLPPLPGGEFGLPGFMGRSGRGVGNVAFTGIVETPEGTLALLENTSTNETRYTRVGDDAFGMSVVDVSPRSVSLDSGGRTIRLAIGENKPDAPPAPVAAAAQAPPAGTTPQAGQPAPSTPEANNPSSEQRSRGGFGRRRGGQRGFGNGQFPSSGQQ